MSLEELKARLNGPIMIDGVVVTKELRAEAVQVCIATQLSRIADALEALNEVG